VDRLKRLRAGSYETQDGKWSITEEEFEKGYWSVYKEVGHGAGDWEWQHVAWGLKAAREYLANEIASLLPSN